MQRNLLFLALLSFLAFTLAKQCEQKPNTMSMDWDKFRGDWFEYKSWGDGWTRWTSRCIKDTFNLAEDGKSYARTRSYKTRLIPIPHTNVNLIEPTGPSQFTITKNSIISSDLPMTLLDSDYVNYAIIWSCKDGWISTSESSWILTRKREPKFDVDMENKIKESLSKFGLTMDGYSDVIQSNCD